MQRRHRAEVLLDLHRQRRIGAQSLVEPAHEGIGRVQIGVAARIDGQADQVAVRWKRHENPRDAVHPGGKVPRGGMKGFGGTHRLRLKSTEMSMIKGQHLVTHVNRGGVGAGLGSLGDVPAQATEAAHVALRIGLVKNVVGILGEQAHGTPVAADERPGAKGQIAQLVRVHGG